MLPRQLAANNVTWDFHRDMLRKCYCLGTSGENPHIFISVLYHHEYDAFMILNKAFTHNYNLLKIVSVWAQIHNSGLFKCHRETFADYIRAQIPQFLDQRCEALPATFSRQDGRLYSVFSVFSCSSFDFSSDYPFCRWITCSGKPYGKP